MVSCPICSKPVREVNINRHIDSDCTTLIEVSPSTSQQNSVDGSFKASPVSSFFQPPSTKKQSAPAISSVEALPKTKPTNGLSGASKKRTNESHAVGEWSSASNGSHSIDGESAAKKHKISAFEKAAPLAERMRPRTLDEVYGQTLVGPSGVLRGLIESDRVPSIILWGAAGSGKTTIARIIANTVGSRFVEINSTSSGVAECKKIFAEARNELGLTGRKTILFCDEIHRFSKSQQDVFLGPVESGQITLIGATTENPSFKVINALLSRCRTFTLQKLSEDSITSILQHALIASSSGSEHPPLLDDTFLSYLAAFSDGDARTALNLLELSLTLATQPKMTASKLKDSLTQTLVYDRAGDQHFDTISALHKSIRGSNPDAALYYLARMLQSGEDPLYIARRLIVIASEDVGLADNSMLSLATAAYTAAQTLGMPEARIPLAHASVALALAPKSTRAYRGLNNAHAALEEPGIAGLPVPIHLKNAPTRLMKEMGYGKEYKYNPNFKDGRVSQDYLPEKLLGRTFLEENDLGEEVDPELEGEERRMAWKNHSL